MSPDDVQAHLAAEPAVAALIQTLAGTTMGGGATAVNPGTGNSIGTVTMGDVAGHNIIKISPNIIVHLTYSGLVRPMPPNHRAAVMRMVEDYQAVFGGPHGRAGRPGCFPGAVRAVLRLAAGPDRAGQDRAVDPLAGAPPSRRGLDRHLRPDQPARPIRPPPPRRRWACWPLAWPPSTTRPEKLQVYNTSPDQLRPLVADYLRREPSGGHLVVVLDGLDEAVGWDVGPDLFPRTMGPGLPHGGLGATSGPQDARRLARRTRVAVGAATFDVPLPTLIREDVADILRQMGNPLDTLATDVDLLGEITRVSEGTRSPSACWSRASRTESLLPVT